MSELSKEELDTLAEATRISLQLVERRRERELAIYLVRRRALLEQGIRYAEVMGDDVAAARYREMLDQMDREAGQ